MAKNFDFSSEDENDIEYWFINEDEYKEDIDNLQKYINKNDLHLVPNIIRKLFEKYIIKVLKIEDLFSEEDDTLRKKINKLKNSNFWINRDCLTAFDTVANYSNRASHYQENDLDYFEIYSLIKSFNLSVMHLFKLNKNNKWIKPNFDINSYNLDPINVYNKEIVSTDEYNEFERHSTNISKDISVKDVNISNLLFNNKIFNIPIYQRKYTWSKKNINDLFDDIISRINDKTSHYFGVIAGKIIRENSNGIKYIKVIDGQQRLTTSIIVIMACYYVLKEEKINNLDKLFDEYFNCLNGEKFENIFHNPAGISVDNDEFKIILSKKYNPNLKYSSNFAENLKLIIQRLNETFVDNKLENIMEFLSVFTNNFILGLVNFNPNRNSNKKELEIFSNLNSKGKSLTLDELIKNQLFNLCSDEVLSQNDKKLEEIYNRCFSNCKNPKDIVNFFNELTFFLKGTEIKSEGLSKEHAQFRDFKEYTLPEILEISNVNKIDNLTLEEFQQVIDVISSFWNNCYMIIYGNSSFVSKTYIYNILSLSDSPKKSVYCSLLFLFNTIDSKFKQKIEKESDKRIIFDTFLHLFKLFSLINLFKNGSDSNPKKEFMKLINKKYKDKEFNDLISCKNFIINQIKLNVISNEDLWIDKDELINKLRVKISNSKSNDYKKILLLLSSYQLSNNSPSGTIVLDDSLEHIMPEDTAKWIDDIREWNDELNEKSNLDIKDYSQKYINSIGNMILLSNINNKTMQNKCFLEKKKYINQSGFKSNLYCNDNDNIDISRKDKWTFEDIKKREQYLYSLIYDIYRSISK